MTSEQHDVYVSCHFMHDWGMCEYFANYLRDNEICSTVRYRRDVLEDRHMSGGEGTYEVRRKYLRDATVLIMLCGRYSSRCRLMDREFCGAVHNTEWYRPMGILVILLPELGCSSLLCAEDRTEGDPPGSYAALAAPLPSRLSDNLDAGIPISVISWNYAVSDPERLMRLIHNAHERRDTNRYVRTRPYP